MDTESQVIHEQMRQTRAALAEKLETLEDQVIGTAKEAACSVQKTVETVTQTVDNTVTAAKETMHETVDALKHAFDLKEHVVEHPWTMMAASTAAGFLAGRLFTGTELRPGARLDEAHAASRPNGATGQETLYGSTSLQPGPDKEGGLRSRFASEIDKVKSMGIGMALGILRDMAVQWAPENMASNVKNVIDSVTVKLGGEPIQGPVLAGSVPGMHEGHEEPAEYGPTPAGRQASSPRW